MNIVTPYPTNIPINTVNVTTESARRDNQLREMITKANANDPGAAERGVANEHEKAKTPQQNQNAAFEGQLQKADDHQKIGERGHGDQRGGQGEQQQGRGQGEQQSQDQGQQKNAANQDREAQQKAREAAKQRMESVKQEMLRQEQAQIQQLKRRDTEVRNHEQAHAAVGGQYAGAPTYTYQQGPDGNRYAVGGEVSIDVSPVSGDPEATIQKMQTVRAAALAPAETFRSRP